MQRRVLIAIVCATAFTCALVSLWFVGSSRGWAGFEPAGLSASAVATPALPTMELVDGIAQTQSGGKAPTAEQIDEIWAAVVEASNGNWTPWMVVIDADSGELISESGLNVPHTPASNMKVLTVFTALTHLDPNSTLTTGVSQDGVNLYLWGEGDITLAGGYGDPNAAYGHAGIEDIADQVAGTIAGTGHSYTLHYQSTLFGPTLRWPGWTASGIEGYAGDVAPFAIDTGRVAPGEWEFVPNSAETTATALAAALSVRGIDVGQPVEGMADGAATVIAEVESATVMDQLRFLLLQSDNTMAEQFCQLAAAASGVDEVDFNSATQNVVDTLAQAGIDTTGVEMRDCSGLDPGSRIPPRVLLGAQQASLAEGSNAKPLTRMLPISGVNGTLSERLSGPSTYANLTGKTGFLGRSVTFAGIGTTISGANLFVAVGSDDTVDEGAAGTIPVIDEFLTKLFAL